MSLFNLTVGYDRDSYKVGDTIQLVVKEQSQGEEKVQIKSVQSVSALNAVTALAWTIVPPLEAHCLAVVVLNPQEYETQITVMNEDNETEVLHLAYPNID